MTLANVSHNGVRSLAVRCEVCHHKAIRNVDAYADEVTVPSHRSEDGLRALRDIGAEVRPNWKEPPEQESLTGKRWN
jgi:hypothetical protein